MSSDCFYVRVRSVQDCEVVFDVLTSTAGGCDDLCASRSFALCLLSDALRRSVDLVWSGLKEPARSEETARRYDSHERAALTMALTREDDWYVNEEWMKKNIARFVADCQLVERRNNLGEAELMRRELAIREQFGGALATDKYHQWQPHRWKQCHNYTLRVTVADPKWAAHLQPDIEFGTTAFDVYYEPTSTESSPT